MDSKRLRPLQVETGDFKTFEAAIKKFRKVVEKEGVIKQAIEKRSFMKPSRKKFLKKQKIKHIRKLEKKQAKEYDSTRR